MCSTGWLLAPLFLKVAALNNIVAVRFPLEAISKPHLSPDGCVEGLFELMKNVTKAVKEDSEMNGVAADKKDGQKYGLLRRICTVLTKVATLFVILEPIWMLLPFAGFLYGSVLQIETLNQNPSTAWLTHFVFPVLTLGWTGPILVVMGFILFLVGAGQIYWAKIRRTGLVTKGLYAFVRHPQYISLTLFGTGILLTWGRAITFIAFFIMMFMYYYLTKSEELTCIRFFGDEYRQYREYTSFIIPGDKLLRPLFAKLPSVKLSTPLRTVGAFMLTLLMSFLLMWLIQSVKHGLQTVPYMTANIPLGETWAEATQIDMIVGEANGIPFLQAGRIAVIRGPYRNAWAVGFAENVLIRLRKSKTLADFLTFLDEPGKDVLIVWCGPYEIPKEPARPGSKAGGMPGGRGPAADPHGPDRVRLILMRCTPSPSATIYDVLTDKSKRKIISGCVAKVNLDLPEGEDFVEADGYTCGPRFPGEELWAFFQKQFAQAVGPAGRAARKAALPGGFSKARVVLVQAPILRTRIEPAFAEEILERLVASKTFRDRMRKTGVGGDIVAVAFPRPGPNWYREHHRKPQISLFVILARLVNGENALLGDLFNAGNRDLLSAFIVPMDFGVPTTEDSVDEITIIGPRRDLEERWGFFLSGIGAGGVRHRH